MFSFLGALTLTTFITAAAGAGQHVSDGELQRFIAKTRFPIGCQDAAVASNTLRAKPTTDPARLHDAATTYRACATGPYGTGASSLANQANFAAAAALLLASRYEPPAAARNDARAAGVLAQAIVDYRRPRSVATPALNDDPSIYRTDAGRIARDAASLIAALPTTSPV
jgi:hypothetical protein